MPVNANSNMSWNGPSTRSMIRRLEDQVNRNADETFTTFVHVRNDMNAVHNRLDQLEERDKEKDRIIAAQAERIKELESGSQVVSVHRPPTCATCGLVGHKSNNSHPLVMPTVRASGPIAPVNPVIMTPASIQR